jgi:2-phospho-L-lactate/phosphoenolpyruvate guanylyltransferase
MRTAAILPVKNFPQAKQRLGAGVGEQLRGVLARAMVADVLVALRETSSVELTIVVTSEPAVVGAARYLGAHVVEDRLQEGQSAAVALGIEQARADGFERVLCVPGDCPALDPGELEALLSKPVAAPEVLLISDRHGTGTNGLLLTPPDAIVPSFGADSCARHQQLAQEASVRCELVSPPSLLLDIDTSADLDVLRERLATIGDRAPRTRATLGSSGQP